MNYNALASLIVGLFLLAVVVQGNGSKFLNKLQTESQFLKWGIAAIALLMIAKSGKLGAIGNGFMALAFAALMLNTSGSKFKAEFDKLFEVKK